MLAGSRVQLRLVPAGAEPEDRSRCRCVELLDGDACRRGRGHRQPRVAGRLAEIRGQTTDHEKWAGRRDDVEEGFAGGYRRQAPAPVRIEVAAAEHERAAREIAADP